MTRPSTGSATSSGMFCRLKDWRRIATRFDRNIKNFIAAIALAAAVIWGCTMSPDPKVVGTQEPGGEFKPALKPVS